DTTPRRTQPNPETRCSDPSPQQLAATHPHVDEQLPIQLCAERTRVTHAVVRARTFEHFAELGDRATVRVREQQERRRVCPHGCTAQEIDDPILIDHDARRELDPVLRLDHADLTDRAVAAPTQQRSVAAASAAAPAPSQAWTSGAACATASQTAVSTAANAA